ncbi:nuclear transport factor 2 family protein [Pseudomonas atacamensis]|uniref:Nuclear transport factor 2 family protein n=1 Tax=Pseudomonas atacamensis TaxID=2565368 RepID=A0AAQ2DA25_9PSED|nr:nuclear transport factor 2 family protein [Pseudomonas atacamensis]QXH75195.1 nuclear transport factor 2 family protein [Pseudomonas atacamensis]THF29645.1 nuclear transport factor 2 family protein [Pseudomonas atacamensis]
MSGSDSRNINEVENYDALLRANLQRVFNERDAQKRIAAVHELFAGTPTMYEPTGIVTGRAAISEVAGALLDQFGADFAFVPEGPAVGHHGLGYLRWHAGPSAGSTVVSGVDVAEISEGKIARLWVLLDPV